MLTFLMSIIRLSLSPKKNMKNNDIKTENTEIAVFFAEQVKQGKENLRLSEAALHKVTEQANDIAETMRLSKNSLDEAIENALRDPLTHLPNRVLFSDRLKQIMYSSNRNNFYSALLYIDLDKFKVTNDTYGHKIGDTILIESALRLNNSIRKTDTVARIGGDEFTVILNNLHSDEGKALSAAHEIAEKIRTNMLSQHVLDFDNYINCCTVSIGVILFKSEETSSKHIVDLADKAMYKAKSVGGNFIQFIDHSGNLL